MLYVAGTTTSKNLVILNAAQPTYGGGGADGWVARINLKVTIISENPLKFTLTTSLAFATYLGGSGSEEVTGIAMDQVTKDVFVTGLTTSANLPTTPGVLQTTFGGIVNGFVNRYSQATGDLAFSTYIGGSGAVESNAIAVYTNLSTGVISEYVAGEAIVSSTGKEGFITALTGTGTGGAFAKTIGSSTFATVASAITTDSDGAIYIAGTTNQPGLATVAPVQ